ncbi:hypothetical protein HU200_039633 [Digitaria exilis]|uniref:Uncharacterized protein n=1 Tax=Digitaria exilis TaxID=1010633 RepID=A0A835EFD9_9POAL|nr:hypothetical protein HU200_039633 [Digitaria exilis]
MSSCSTSRPRSSAIIDAPLMLFQVTRLACGGFIILAVRVNHAMADGLGMVQFGVAIAELARAARESDHVRRPGVVPVEVPHGGAGPGGRRGDGMMCAVNVRGITRGAAAAGGGGGGIPRGYYGNAAVCSVAVSAAGALCANPVSYAVELVNKAKEEVDMEYIGSAADLIVLRGRPPLSFKRTYVVSDVRKAPAAHLDFGWGRPVYGGPAEVGGDLAWVASYFVSVTNDRGEELGIAVPVCLPRPAMERFAEEMGKLLQRPLVDVAVRQRPRSAL